MKRVRKRTTKTLWQIFKGLRVGEKCIFLGVTSIVAFVYIIIVLLIISAFSSSLGVGLVMTLLLLGAGFLLTGFIWELLDDFLEMNDYYEIHWVEEE